MPTTGSFVFSRALTADSHGIIQDPNTITKGEWAWIDRTTDWSDEEGRGSRRWLMIYARCPDCGFLSTLWRIGAPSGRDHQVGPDGTLHPSVECTHVIEGKKCGFHTQPTRLGGFVDIRGA